MSPGSVCLFVLGLQHANVPAVCLSLLFFCLLIYSPGNYWLSVMCRHCSQCWWFITEPIPTALLYSTCNCGWPEMFLLMCIETARKMYIPIYILSHWSVKNMCIHTNILTYATQMFSFTQLDPEYSLEGLMLKLQYFGHLM